MALTLKQQKFADEYIISGNATDAARKAGYKQPHVQGSQNLEKLSVKAYIDTRLEKLKSSKVADQQEILEFLTAVQRGEIKESVATAKGIYEDVDTSTKDRIKAAELLGKRHAMWTEKVDLSSNTINIKIGDQDG